MDNIKITRKNFIKSSALGVAGITLSSNKLYSTSMGEENKLIADNFILKNVRLETGFEYENEVVIGTTTALFTIEIAAGKIKNIGANQPNLNVIDAKGLLMLPSFKDMHIHLDKTLYPNTWRAVRRSGGIKGMIALEKEVIPDLLRDSTDKAEKLIELLQSFGTGFARSHVNIEPTSKLDSLKNLEKALANKKKGFGAELVAFPQHGLYYTDSLPYMKEAAKMNIDFIGGLDPISVDGSLERTMDTTIQLALDHQKGIDIHLHESGESGVQTIQYLINKVQESPELKGKTFVSHAFALGNMDKVKLESLAEQLAAAEIGIISSIPFGGLIMPIPTLLKYGVNVFTGNDSIVDYWNTMGTGSVLQKANLAAQLYGQTSEFGLSRMLKLATAGPIPLNDQGVQQWPKIGDVANIALIEASCSAEAVARMSPVRSLYHQGNKVY